MIVVNGPRRDRFRGEKLEVSLRRYRNLETSVDEYRTAVAKLQGLHADTRSSALTQPYLPYLRLKYVCGVSVKVWSGHWIFPNIFGSFEGNLREEGTVISVKTMGGCFNFSLVTYFYRRQQAFYRSCGLEARLVELDGGTIMSCWIPRRSKERAVNASQKPALVMLHAFGTSGISWSYQVAPFSKEFDLYIPDLVFFGDSSSTNTARSEFFQAESVYKVLQQLGVNKFSVIGTSYGGFVAYRIAHSYPDSVQKLVISSSGVCMDPSSDQALCAKYNLKNIKEVLLPTTVDGLKRTAGLGFHKKPRIFIPRFVMEDYLETHMMKNYKERCELADGMVLGKADSPPLETVPQETLIIWGEFDEVFNLKLAYQLKQHIGENAQVIVINNAAHVPQVEKASEYNKKVLVFLSERKSQ